MKIKNGETYARKSRAIELYLSGTTHIEEERVQPYRSLLEAPRPRKVRVKPGPRVLLFVFAAVAASFLCSGLLELRTLHQGSSHFSPFDSPVVSFGIAAIFLVVSGATFSRTRRDSILLKDGDLAIGVVTHQKIVLKRGGRGGARKASRIRYRFRDASGQLFQGTGTDESRLWRVDMTVPVFYKRGNAKKNVAICTATCELDTSTG